jgi:hypothetical protein
VERNGNNNQPRRKREPKKQARKKSNIGFREIKSPISPPKNGCISKRSLKPPAREFGNNE